MCVIPGDDAAPEAMAASLRVLDALDLPIDWDHVPVGDELAALTPDEREALVGGHIDAADTVLFGSSERHHAGGGLHALGQAHLRQRAAGALGGPGYASPLARPEGIDYVIVRENLEDMYVGVMGPAQALLDAGLTEGRSRVPPDAANGRFAAEDHHPARHRAGHALRRRAGAEPRRQADRLGQGRTCCLRPTGGFCDIAREVAQDYPSLEYEQFIIDDMAHRLVVRPHELDVLLLPNLYGDILSDQGAGTIGGMGLAPSGCYGDDWAYFESAHGTAPDIAGQGIINPTATLESAEMMLRHLDLDAPADRLDRSLAAVYEVAEHLTPDQGGTAGTEDFASAVVENL